MKNNKLTEEIKKHEEMYTIHYKSLIYWEAKKDLPGVEGIISNLKKIMSYHAEEKNRLSKEEIIEIYREKATKFLTTGRGEAFGNPLRPKLTILGTEIKDIKDLDKKLKRGEVKHYIRKNAETIRKWRP